MWEAINQLSEGKTVDLKLIMETPEMKLGNQCYMNHGSDTVLMNPVFRRLVQEGILR